MEHAPVRQQQRRRVVHARHGIARQRGPRPRRRTPQLRGVDRPRGIVEPGGAGAAGHEHVTGGEERGVAVPAGVLHRAGVRPRRIRLVQVDNLRRIGRRIPAADVEDSPRLVHDGGPVAPCRVEVATRAGGPAPGAGDVEPARRLQLAGIEHAPVRRHEVPWIVLQRQARGRQFAPRRPRPHLGDGHDRAAFVGAGDGNHFTVRQSGVGRVPPPLSHRRPRLPRARCGVEHVGVRQAVVVVDVPTGDQQPPVREKVVTGAEQKRRTRDRREDPRGRVPHLWIADVPPAQHRPVGQQMDVELHDRRRKHRRPLADLRLRPRCRIRYGVRRGIRDRKVRTVARDRILATTEKPIPIPQLGRIGIQQQAEVGGGAGEPIPDDGRHVPLLEPGCLVHAPGIRRRADVRLRQRDVVATARVRGPGIDAVVRVACGPGDVRVLVHDLVHGDGIGRIRGAITLCEIEMQRGARDRGPRRNAPDVELHDDGVGNRVVWPGIDAERGVGRIARRVEIQKRVPRRRKHRRRFARRRCGRGDGIHDRQGGSIGCDRILAAAERSIPVPQLRWIGIHQQAEIGGGGAQPSLHQRGHVPLFESRRLVDGLGVHGGTDVRLGQRNVVVTTRIRRPVVHAVVRVAGRLGQSRVLVDDLVHGDGIGRIRGGITLREIEIQRRTRNRRSGRDAREIELEHAGVGDLVVRPGIQVERRRRRIVGRIDVQVAIGGGADDDGRRLNGRRDPKRVSRVRDGAFVLARHEGQRKDEERKPHRMLDDGTEESEAAHTRFLRRGLPGGEAESLACIRRATATDGRL